MSSTIISQPISFNALNPTSNCLGEAVAVWKAKDAPGATSWIICIIARPSSDALYELSFKTSTDSGNSPFAISRAA